MQDKDLGASALPTGLSPSVEPVPVSPPDGASIPSAGDLRIWWIPQVPMAAFEVGVRDLEQASLLLSVLSDYDNFQFQHNVKPDYCNIGGLSIFEDGEWVDWWSEDGLDFNEVRRDPELFASAMSTASTPVSGEMGS